MATTHLIAIDGDKLTAFAVQPSTAAALIAELCRTCGSIYDVQEYAFTQLGISYVGHSMDGLRGVIENASREYL